MLKNWQLLHISCLPYNLSRNKMIFYYHLLGYVTIVFKDIGESKPKSGRYAKKILTLKCFKAPPLQIIRSSSADFSQPNPNSLLFSNLLSASQIWQYRPLLPRRGLKSSIKPSEGACCDMGWASRWCWHEGLHCIISHFHCDYLNIVILPLKRGVV